VAVGRKRKMVRMLGVPQMKMRMGNRRRKMTEKAMMKVNPESIIIIITNNLMRVVRKEEKNIQKKMLLQKNPEKTNFLN
jgi:hypothetical protein